MVLRVNFLVHGILTLVTVPWPPAIGRCLHATARAASMQYLLVNVAAAVLLEAPIFPCGYAITHDRE